MGLSYVVKLEKCIGRLFFFSNSDPLLYSTTPSQKSNTPPSDYTPACERERATALTALRGAWNACVGRCVGLCVGCVSRWHTAAAAVQLPSSSSASGLATAVPTLLCSQPQTLKSSITGLQRKLNSASSCCCCSSAVRSFSLAASTATRVCRMLLKLICVSPHTAACGARQHESEVKHILLRYAHVPGRDTAITALRAA